MRQGPLDAVARHVRTLGRVRAGQDATDTELLRQFVVARDEAAFTALVERHGGLVWSVCRRVLRRREDGLESFDALVARTGLSRREIPNPGRPIDSGVLKPMLATAIASVREAMRAERQSFNETLRARLDDHIKCLRALRERHLSHLEDMFAAEGGLVAAREARKARRRRDIDRLFEDHQSWARETMTTEDSPFLQVIAVLRSA